MQGKPTLAQQFQNASKGRLRFSSTPPQEYNIGPVELNKASIALSRLATYEAALMEIADSPGSEKLAVIARKALEDK